MQGTYTALTQSKFFNPAFNSAIFDGPIRIYFAQMHESLALKIYFSLQQDFSAILNQCKEAHKMSGKTVLVMLYPTPDSFAMSFESEKNFLSQEELHGDIIVGVNGPFGDDKLPAVLQQIVGALKDWDVHVASESQSEAAL
jgi:hypothetical protein